MPYRIEIGPKAKSQLEGLDAAIEESIERKLLWLGDNATGMIHRRLTGMPEDLSGLCKLRIGDYRILYWVYREKSVVRIYRVAHRSEVYRDL